MTSAQKAISSISTAGKRQPKAFVQRIEVVATADNYSGTQDVEAATHSTGQNLLKCCKTKGRYQVAGEVTL